MSDQTPIYVYLQHRDEQPRILAVTHGPADKIFDAAYELYAIPQGWSLGVGPRLPNPERNKMKTSPNPLERQRRYREDNPETIKALRRVYE